MFEESTPRTSSKWKPHKTFSANMGDSQGYMEKGVVQDVERRGSAY